MRLCYIKCNLSRKPPTGGRRHGLQPLDCMYAVLKVDTLEAPLETCAVSLRGAQAEASRYALNARRSPYLCDICPKLQAQLFSVSKDLRSGKKKGPVFLSQGWLGKKNRPLFLSGGFC